MFLIGITGGVGAGKTELLSELETMEAVRVVRADELAASLMQPGSACHDRLAEAFAGLGVFDKDGNIIKAAMSSRVISDPDRRAVCNGIVHPAVKEELLRMAEEAASEGGTDIFFIEAALLLEEGYDLICDEIWYIWASEEVRRRRLVSARGYSQDRISALMASQLKEEVFRTKCQRIIDNDGNLSTAREQLNEYVRELKSRIRTSEGKPAKETAI